MAPMLPEGEPTKGKSGRALLLASGALVVVAAIVVGLLFVFGVFKSDKGASSPEAAVSDLLSAAVTLKPADAVKAIAPSEVDGFSGLAKAANSPAVKSAMAKFDAQIKSQMEQLAATPGMPSSVGSAFAAYSGISRADIQGALKAVSVKLTNMRYTTTELASGIADVTVNSGDVTISVDSTKIPADLRQKVSTMINGTSDVPSWVTDLLSGNKTVSHTWHIGDWSNAAAVKGQKLDLIVVQQDGGWYVSMVGTIAQHIYEGVTYDRQMNGQSPLAQPNWNLYANPPQAIIASSPEQVPANIAKAFSHKSMMEIFQNLPQSEVRTLFPFVPLLQAAADSGSGS
ncbi:MAG TPA: hypothetical protein VN108_09225, partial [Marmoricola sp.]|nr:hypothetical protein [Marmoricola sp.]